VVAVSLVWVVPAACAAVDWWAVARGNRRVETWAKPATLAGLVLVAVVLGAGQSAAGWWLLVALGLSLAGDVLLLGDSQRRFLLGLAAFLAGHLAYVACFVLLGLESAPWSPLAWLVLAAAVVTTRRVVPSAHASSGLGLAVPVVLYTLVIGAMVVLAFGTGRPLVALGATVFAASDSLLALNRFVDPRPWAPLAVMMTYHVGQALIVAGVLAGG
jgi:uncharacterized membrane protein YhhN